MAHHGVSNDLGHEEAEAQSETGQASSSHALTCAGSVGRNDWRSFLVIFVGTSGSCKHPNLLSDVPNAGSSSSDAYRTTATQPDNATNSESLASDSPRTEEDNDEEELNRLLECKRQRVSFWS